MKTFLDQLRGKNVVWISFAFVSFFSTIYLVWNKYLTNTNPTNAEDFSFAFVDLINDVKLIVFFLLILIVPFFSEETKNSNNKSYTLESHHRRLFNTTWKTVAFLWITAIVTIIIVNPRGLYRIRIFPQLSDDFRNTRVANYLDLNTTPELVILGSSRTITISPDYITQELGYSAYNFGIAGARANDITLITRFILSDGRESYPGVLLIEVGPTFHNSSDAVVRAPLYFIRYMDPGIATFAIANRFLDLFNIFQLAESVYVIQYSSQGFVQETYEIINPNGYTTIKPTLTFEEVWANYLEQGEERYPCKNFNPDDTEYLKEVVSLAQEHNTSIVFYTSPLLPQYYETFYNGSPRFDECMAHLLQRMSTLSDGSSIIFFQDLMVSENLNILIDESGYYDGQHLKPINANLMIDVLAETITQAFDAASELRNQP
ncbi:MAG: hypothetical protein FVQ83_12030 [Chloroflexi bacterium]|nr:hypothetical protein [Chloroflexota bacterium]